MTRLLSSCSVSRAVNSTAVVLANTQGCIVGRLCKPIVVFKLFECPT